MTVPSACRQVMRNIGVAKVISNAGQVHNGNEIGLPEVRNYEGRENNNLYTFHHQAYTYYMGSCRDTYLDDQMYLNHFHV